MRTIFVFILLNSFCYLFAQQRIEPYSGSRIFWDTATEKIVFENGNYGRMIQLHDGRLMAVAQFGPGIGVTFSMNKGFDWSTPTNIAPNPFQIVNSVPDCYQLTDGTILVGYNPRPKEPYSTDRKFGIRVRRSTNNGLSWGNEIFIFDATHTNADGCWEPAFLELPSGEIHCYFANEFDYQSSNEQNISVCRSFDKGLTWSAPEIVCFRSGSRDGMPVPLLLKESNDIVVAIEDNGYPGYKPRFQPSIIKSTLANNWSKGFVNANSSDRIYALSPALPTSTKAAAPYIRKLPWGETILSYQGSEGRTSTDDSVLDMFVAVGNNKAQKFKAISRPFAVALNKKALWNSLSVIDTGIVVAVTSTNQYTTNNQIRMIKGYPVRQVNIKKGTITVDGIQSTNEKWSTPRAEQLIMGNIAKARCGVDFLYDDTYLYITAKVYDKFFVNDKSANDGIRLMLDVDDVSTSNPQAGTFSMFFDANGTVSFLKGQNGSWISSISDGIISAIKNEAGRFYILEAAIPWSILGKSAPPTDVRMALALELWNINSDGYTIETIADVNKNAPYTWVETRLITESASKVKSTKESGSPISIMRNSSQVTFNAIKSISHIEQYSLSGTLLHSRNIQDNTFVMNRNNILSVMVFYFNDKTVYSHTLIM